MTRNPDGEEGTEALGAPEGLPKWGARQRTERFAARLGAAQALYQLDVSAAAIDRVIEEFLAHRFGVEIEGETLPLPDEAHFERLIRGVVKEQRAIDQGIEEALSNDWSIRRLDRTLRALLRAGFYEMIFLKEIPAGVVIDEYVNVAHAFFSGEPPKLAHGLLEAARKRHRPEEREPAESPL